MARAHPAGSLWRRGVQARHTAVADTTVVVPRSIAAPTERAVISFSNVTWLKRIRKNDLHAAADEMTSPRHWF